MGLRLAHAMAADSLCGWAEVECHRPHRCCGLDPRSVQVEVEVLSPLPGLGVADAAKQKSKPQFIENYRHGESWAMPMFYGAQKATSVSGEVAMRAVMAKVTEVAAMAGNLARRKVALMQECRQNSEWVAPKTMTASWEEGLNGCGQIVQRSPKMFVAVPH